MAENLKDSATKEKPRTRQTEKLTPDQALEVLATAINHCQQAGISAGVSEFFDDGRRGVVIVLENIVLANGRMMLATEETEGT